jgi:hypothetical protein
VVHFRREEPMPVEELRRVLDHRPTIRPLQRDTVRPRR